MRLIIATGNPGKAKEFREMLGADRFQWSDLSAHRDVPAVEETGHTFRANACLKAAHYARALGAWAMADDSGLAVDALEGKPGVHSARWAALHEAGHGAGSAGTGSAGADSAGEGGRGAADARNNALLLEQIEHVPDERRTARFCCVLALADPQGRIILTAQDSVEGRLLRSPRGSNGFGYDPLFFIPPLGRTAAELEPEEKHAISHRGKALRHMRKLMERLPAM